MQVAARWRNGGKNSASVYAAWRASGAPAGQPLSLRPPGKRLVLRVRRMRSADNPVCYYAAHSRLPARIVKQFIDFIPLLLFFAVYKLEPRIVEIAGHKFALGGIFSATAVLILSSLLVYGALLVKQRRLDKSQLITLAACLVFGGLTLAFHSETVLKWKAPVVNALFALAFAGSQLFGDKPLVQRLMGHVVELPAAQWARLNAAWVAFFLVCGGANLFVAFTFPAIWVDFKVFGSLGLTLLFMIGQSFYLVRHMQTTPAPSKE